MYQVNCTIFSPQIPNLSFAYNVYTYKYQSDFFIKIKKHKKLKNISYMLDIYYELSLFTI